MSKVSKNPNVDKKQYEKSFQLSGNLISFPQMLQDKAQVRISPLVFTL